MLLASVAAGLAAPWLVLLASAIIWLSSSNSANSDGSWAVVPAGAALSGGIFGVLLYFPYSFARQRRGWTFRQDLVLHVVAAVALMAAAMLQSPMNTGTPFEVIVRTIAVCLGVAVLTVPAPIIFALVLPSSRPNVQES